VIERRILALGGHDFDRRDGNDAICDLVVELAPSPKPRICLLPTASGDPQDQIARFRRAFGERDCVPSIVSLFRLGENPVDLREELLGQDAIYVGGGSLLNLIAVWRAHSLDRILRECWLEGVLLCGQSAGAMCWFERGITSSSGRPAIAAGLGVLPGAVCVHYLSEPQRRRRFLRAIEREELDGGLGLDDQTGIVFAGTEMTEAVSARSGATVWEVSRRGGEPSERRLTARELEAARPPINDTRAEILEFRRTRAARATSAHGRRGRRG
jgi:dipeptidase E